VIFVSTTPASLAVKEATKSIPVVFVGVADPLGVGLVKNLARPEGNITGVTNIVAELTGKRMALLKELVPGVSRIALLVNPDDPNAGVQMAKAREAARGLGLELAPILHIRRATDLGPAFAAAARSEVKAALRLVDPTTTMLRNEMAALAASHRLAIVYPFRQDAEAGGLASYGPDLAGQYRQAATFVDKLLRGAHPGNLPVEQPVRFELVINLKTANALGLSVPASLRLQADQLIE
jgi:putative ABC transport system substrate-binding protein